MSETHVELSDIITPLKKIVRRPSSPSSKSKASSPTLSTLILVKSLIKMLNKFY